MFLQGKATYASGGGLRLLSAMARPGWLGILDYPDDQGLLSALCLTPQIRDSSLDTLPACAAYLPHWMDAVKKWRCSVTP